MIDKVQKIREEVVRLKSLIGNNSFLSDYEKGCNDGREDVCDELISIIDSLEEEPKPRFKVGDTIRYKKENDSFKILAIEDDCYKLENNIVVSVAAQDSWELVEEPVSEEMEEAANEWDRKAWFSPISMVMDGDRPIGTKQHITSHADSFKAGAKWKEKEMQSTIELAEDHAMLAGMEKAKEQIMKNLWKIADGDNLPEYEREVVAFQEIFPTDVDVPSLLKIVIAHRPNPEGYDGKSLTTGEVEHYTPKTYDKGGWNIPDVKWWLDCLLPNMEED